MTFLLVHFPRIVNCDCS